MENYDYPNQTIISELHATLEVKEKIIAEYQNKVQMLNDQRIATSNALSDLQYAIKSFFEDNCEGDNVEFNIDEANEFLVENNIAPLKRDYRVYFTIEGYFTVEAESEEDAKALTDGLDVSHYTEEIEYSTVMGSRVEAVF
jgi:hypothetical protein